MIGFLQETEKRHDKNAEKKKDLRTSVNRCQILRIFFIFTVFTLREFFTLVLRGGFSSTCDWQQISSVLQDTSEYSNWSLMWCGLDIPDSPLISRFHNLYYPYSCFCFNFCFLDIILFMLTFLADVIATELSVTMVCEKCYLCLFTSRTFSFCKKSFQRIFFSRVITRGQLTW